MIDELGNLEEFYKIIKELFWILQIGGLWIIIKTVIAQIQGSQRPSMLRKVMNNLAKILWCELCSRDIKEDKVRIGFYYVTHSMY